MLLGSECTTTPVYWVIANGAPMNLTFRKFSAQDTDDVYRLLNDASIRRHLPLAMAADSFSVEFVQQWIAQSFIPIRIEYCPSRVIPEGESKST